MREGELIGERDLIEKGEVMGDLIKRGGGYWRGRLIREGGGGSYWRGRLNREGGANNKEGELIIERGAYNR